MKHFKRLLKVCNWRISNLNMGVFCLLFLLTFIFTVAVNVNEVYSAGNTLSAVSPLRQQIKLSQPSAVAPGGRGLMIPQSVVIKDAEGKPVEGKIVTFEVLSNDTVKGTMRGYDSNVMQAATNANGIATAANTHPTYQGEGFQVFSISSEAVITTLKLKASAEGCSDVTFDVEVGTVQSNMIDNTPPIVDYTLKDGTGADYIIGTWTKNPVTVTYTAKDALSMIASCTEPQVFSEEGANQFSKGIAIDTSPLKNKTEVDVGPINIDKTAPETIATKTGNDSWNNETVNIQFNSKDSVSGVDAIYYKIGSGPETKVDASNSITIDADGLSDMSYWAVDKAGNKEEAKTISAKIDKSAPTITSEVSPDKNANGWNDTNVKVVLKATDSNSGVKEIHYKIGETGAEQVVSESSVDFSVDTEGVTDITFWAVDNTGNASTPAKTQVKIDKTNPVVTAPKDILVEATAVRTPIQIGTATFEDISEVKLSNDAPTDGCFGIGTTTVKWTATDQVGKTTSVIQHVTVKDTTKPLLTVQGALVVEATGILTPVTVGPAKATDIFKVTVTNNAPKEGFSIGDREVVFTAIDENGNEVTATQIVTVKDRKNPVITLPPNIEMEATAIKTPVDIGQATATDIFPVTVEKIGPTEFPIGKNEVTWKATDANNNVTTGVQEILIKDTTAPVLIIPSDITIEATEVNMHVKIGDAKATDIFSFDITNNAPEYYNVGTKEVIWEAKDQNGNVSKKVQKITVTDKTLPVLVKPDDMQIQASGITSHVDLKEPVATDIFKVTITNNAPPNNMFPIGKTVVTWTATDANGNAATVQQIVEIIDTIKPALSLSENVKKEATAVKTPVSVTKATATDIFATTVTWKVKLPDGTVLNEIPNEFPVGVTTITWTAVDANKNTSTEDQTIEITDKTNPVLSLSESVKTEATAVKTPVSIAKATAADIFATTVTCKVTLPDGTVLNELPAVYPIGVTNITWTATDVNGNASTAKQTVEIIDTTNPVLSLSENVKKEATAVKTPVNVTKATATDIFGTAVVCEVKFPDGTVINKLPAEYPIGITKITWTANDANKNTSTAEQTVEITDTTIPVLLLSENVKTEATALKTPVSVAKATATDIFTVIVSCNVQLPDKTVINKLPTEYMPGTTTITWTARDANGNTSTAVQTIEITDTTKPVLSLSENVKKEATAVLTPVIVAKATATDIFATTVACEVKLPDGTVLKELPAEFPEGLTKITWTAKDANGNESTDEQTVEITDTTNPVLSISKDIKKEATAVKTPVTVEKATATDIFKVTVVCEVTLPDKTELGELPAEYPIGVTKIKWTATDLNGNISTGEQTVEITDITKPVLTLSENVKKEATAVKTPVSIAKATAADIFATTVTCKVELPGGTILNELPAEYPIGITKITWTATDANGNAETAVQTVEITDTTNPVLTLSENVKKEATAVKTPVSVAKATAADIFATTVTFEVKLPDGKVVSELPTEYPLGITKITWTAVDANGNTSKAEQTVEITDTTRPILILSENVKKEATAINTPVTIERPHTTEIFTYTVTCEVKLPDGTVLKELPVGYPIGITKITWTATDANGNSTTAEQTVEIVDTTTPVLTLSENVKKEATAVKTPVTVTKAAVAEIFTTTLTCDVKLPDGKVVNELPAEYPIGITKITWKAIDANGNESTGVQTVEITDTTAPTLLVSENLKKEATAVKTPVSVVKATAKDIFTYIVTCEVKLPDGKVLNELPAEYPIGLTEITWTAVDANGNSSTAKQTVEIIDTTKPVLSLSENVKKEATAVKTPVSVKRPTTTDIFSMTIGCEVKFPDGKIVNELPAEYPIGVTEITWTVVDANGNISTAKQTVEIIDTTKPVLSLSENVKKEATAVKTPVSVKEATATDIFSMTIGREVTLPDGTVLKELPAEYPIGVTKITWTAIDANGNISKAEQTVEIIDTTKPVISTLENVKKEATAVKTPVSIEAPKTADIFATTVTCKVELPDGTALKELPAEYPIGITKITWTAIDANGNASTSEQTVEIIDTTTPVLTVSKNVKKEATAVKTPGSIEAAKAADIFATTVTCKVELPDGTVLNELPAEYPLGVTKITWTAKDANGNTSIAGQTVEIIDTTTPVLSATKNVKKEATAIKTPLDIPQATATDIFATTVTCKVELPDKTVLNELPAEYPIGVTKITWTATDANGNTSIAEQTVEIIDTTRPVLSVTEVGRTEATAVKTIIRLKATATDIFPVTISIDSPVDYAPIVTIEPNTYYIEAPIGITKITWKATDANGNSTSVEQIIEIIDTTKPVISKLENVKKEATAVKTPVSIEAPKATDIFATTVTCEVKLPDGTVLKELPAEYPIGLTKIIWTAVDSNGNASTSEQTVEITDTTKPVISKLENVKEEATAVKTPVSIETPKAADIFATTVTCKVELPDGTVLNELPAGYPIGISKITWTAIDANGNASTSEQTVEITDTTKPVISKSENAKEEATAVKTPVSIKAATATDIFATTVTCTVKLPDGTVLNELPAEYPIGITKITWTATDANGNAETAEQTVEIIDTTKPVISTTENVKKEATAVKTPVSIVVPKAADIFATTVTCKVELPDGTVLNELPAEYPIGVTKITWTATDANGNASTSEQTVEIIDTTKPVISMSENAKKEATAVKTPVSIKAATAADIFATTVTCKVILPDGTVLKELPAEYPIGITKITWTATDANGNASTSEQTVEIIDTTKPVISMSENAKKEATAVKTPVSIKAATAADIFATTVTCKATLPDGTILNELPAEYPIGLTKITWTAVDSNGNTSTGVQAVLIIDTTKPVISKSENVKKEATAVKTPVSIKAATAADIFATTVTCKVTLPDGTILNELPAEYPIGVTKITWTATDANGNASKEEQTVEITDTTKPVLTAPANLTVPATAARTKVAIGTATATDIFAVNVTSDAPADFPIGTTTVTWTATDANGNVSTAVQTVTVIQKLRLKAFNNTRAATVNTLDPRFELENISSSDINLSDLKIRYYFTADGDKKQTYWCDYAQVNGTSGQRNITSAVSGTFQKCTTKPQCDSYVEISFNSTAGVIKPGEKVSINGRFSKEDWSNYTQTNDYSFNASATNYTETSKVTVYASGILISGTEP